MSWKQIAPIAGLALASTAFGQAKKAPPPKKEIREIIATGCVLKAVESGCLLLRTLDGSTVYSLFGDNRPDPGIVVTVEGKQHSGPTACMQGVPIDVKSWQATGEKCSR